MYLAESTVTREYHELKKSIETRIYVQLAFMFVFTIVVVFVGLFFSRNMAQSMLNPLQDLTAGIENMTSSQTILSVREGYEEHSYEMNLLYTTFEKMLSVILFAYEKEFESADVAIERYMNVLKLFKELGLDKGIGICENNLGNIYFNLQAYEDACECFKRAIEISIKEKNKLERDRLFAESHDE